jgi:predicted nucleic acid-binding protein
MKVLHVVSNTGPLISAFQSDSFGLVKEMFQIVHLPRACLEELDEHGWMDKVWENREAIRIHDLTSDERAEVLEIAERISYRALDKEPVHHLGEAEVIVLAKREEFKDNLVLIDELAAREVALEEGLVISGFPGVLVRAVERGLINPEELRKRLKICQSLGTWYGSSFIEEVYRRVKGGGLWASKEPFMSQKRN